MQTTHSKHISSSLELEPLGDELELDPRGDPPLAIAENIPCLRWFSGRVPAVSLAHETVLVLSNLTERQPRHELFRNNEIGSETCQKRGLSRVQELKKFISASRIDSSF